jgi:hypothetical protein
MPTSWMNLDYVSAASDFCFIGYTLVHDKSFTYNCAIDAPFKVGTEEKKVLV